jgi:SAM-dependent methyltransferase
MEAAEWDRRYADTELVWSAGPNRFLVEQVADLPVGRALDLAAGEGRNAVWLAQQGWRVTAVDFSEVGIDKGRRVAAAADVRIDWVVADVTVWDAPPQAFELVIVFYLHLPAEDRRAVHRRAATAVADGGRLLIVGHHLDNLEVGVGGPQDPAVLTTPAGIVDDLAGTGLRILSAEAVERQVETDAGTKLALDALVLAERATAG